MRVEKIGGRVTITQPAAEREEERRALLSRSVLSGVLGTAALVRAWLQTADPIVGVWGIMLSIASACMFHQFQTTRDKAWTLVLNREQKSVVLDGSWMASFHEVRAVCSSTIEPSRHVLSLVVHRGRGSHEIPLCSISGTDADRAVFEQAARLIAEEIGVRAERR